MEGWPPGAQVGVPSRTMLGRPPPPPRASLKTDEELDLEEMRDEAVAGGGGEAVTAEEKIWVVLRMLESKEAALATRVAQLESQQAEAQKEKAHTAGGKVARAPRRWVQSR